MHTYMAVLSKNYTSLFVLECRHSHTCNACKSIFMKCAVESYKITTKMFFENTDHVYRASLLYNADI